MGFMDFLFGGTKNEVMDTSTPEIRSIADQLANYDPGLGMAGRMAKGGIKRWYQDPSSGPLAQLAIARGATDWRELQRNIQMNTAMMPGEQQALTAGLLAKGQLQNQNQTGMNVLQGSAGDIENFTSAYNLARSQRINAELTGKQSAGSILTQNRRVVQKQTPGLIGGLSQIAGLFSPIGAGLGALRGLGGGMGSLPPLPGTGAGTIG